MYNENEMKTVRNDIISRARPFSLYNSLKILRQVHNVVFSVNNNVFETRNNTILSAIKVIPKK